MPRKILNSLSLLAASMALISCSGSGTLNQGTPPGTLIETGTMSGQATATVSVYQSGTLYYAQLAGLSYSASCGVGVNIGVVAGGSYVAGPPLTTTQTGSTANYQFPNLSGAPSAVFIYCNGANPISSGIKAQTTVLSPA